MYRQYDLSSGPARLTCWLDWPSKIRVGARLTIDGDHRIWQVERSGDDGRITPPDKSWKVGGLV